MSLALGIFVGILPIWGFQTVIAIFLAVSFRLNKLLAFAASNISIPPMIPVIVIASIKIGGFVLNKEPTPINFTSFENFKSHFVEYLVGSVILATFTALIVGCVSYAILNTLKKKRKKQNG